MKQTVTQNRSQDHKVLIAAGVWMITFFIALIGLRQTEWAVGVKVTLAFLPILPFAFFLWSFVNSLREMDELERKIHLEALVIAFPLMMLFLMTLGLLELAIDLNPNDWSYRHVWAFAPLFYFIGVVWARRRYL
jgi:hypothetical protein